MLYSPSVDFFHFCIRCQISLTSLLTFTSRKSVIMFMYSYIHALERSHLRGRDAQVFKISDFSRLSQVSMRTLRYYDEIGLLKPGQVDCATGYRYYSIDQLPRLNRILALKDLGFEL